ncbi:MAG: ABC transporter ATP-binding protein [Candidatus Saccharimonadales bacterium]
MDLRRGEIACLVGTNGCGKTTLLLTALGVLPHRGECLLYGRPYDGTDSRLKARIGFIPDDPELLFEELTATEQWSVAASVLRQSRSDAEYDLLMSRARHLANRISFNPPSQIARTYSHGMRKKTQIVSALLGKPEVVIIDELRNGLDPIAIRQTEGLIKSERDRGAAVLVATHDLWWAERFADYIYVLDKGRVVAQGTLRQLLLSHEPNLETAFYRIVGADVCN